MAYFAPLSFEFHNPERHERLLALRDARICRLVEMDMDTLNERIICPEEIQLEAFLLYAPSLTPNHRDVMTFRLSEDSRISCTNWQGRHFISGTDIVRVMAYRYQLYTGKPPVFLKKFEEGIFSDLRRLSPPNDCVLEPTRSEFLEFLFSYDCVRSKKKQKVFFWHKFCSSAHSLFCDALERELGRIEMAKAVNMSMEEFLKSGLVPTGVSASIGGDHVFGAGSPTDWTRWAEYERFGTVDGQPAQIPPLKPAIGMDQVHIIRNDISSTFTRLLRIPMRKRHERLNQEMLTDAEAKMRARTEVGKPLPANLVPTTIVRRPFGHAPATGASDDTDQTQSDGSMRSPATSPRHVPKGRIPKTKSTASASPLARAVAKAPKAKAKKAGRPLSNMYIGNRPRLPLPDDFEDWSSDEEQPSVLEDEAEAELASTILLLKGDKRASVDFDDAGSEASKKMRTEVDRALTSSPDMHTDSSAGPSPASMILDAPPATQEEAEGAVFVENKGAKQLEAACILLGLSGNQ